MGPYYRGTSQATGAFFDMFYQQPVLMAAIVGGLVGIGIFSWWRKRSSNNS